MTKDQEQEAAVQAAIGEMQIITTMLTQRCASHAAQLAISGLKNKDLLVQIDDARKELKAINDARTPDPRPRPHDTVAQ